MEAASAEAAPTVAASAEAAPTVAAATADCPGIVRADRRVGGRLLELLVEHSGEHRGRLDLKHGGLLPIVDLARWAGMAAGVTSASTVDRLHSAARAGTLPAADALTLEEAFDLVTTLRLGHQVEQLRASGEMIGEPRPIVHAVKFFEKGDRPLEIRGIFGSPPDVVAHPRAAAELEAGPDWCATTGYATIPYGGGSSVVDGVTPPEGYDGIVTIDMDQFDRVLEIDATSRAARIQAGVYGPALEDQLRPQGFTLRHFPQSFTMSTLGGWIATRSGGHYATNHTHIDDFVESARLLHPAAWRARRRRPRLRRDPRPAARGSRYAATTPWPPWR